jgi:two-component system sensor kinase FixL
MHGRVPPEPSPPAPPHPQAAAPARAFGLRVHLALLMLAVLLPALAFGGAALWQAVDAHRAAVEAQVRGTARALALAVDRDIAAHLALAAALADMPEADPDTGDLREFADLAQRLVLSLSAWAVLSEAGTGQQLVNTRLPPGAPLPAKPLPGGPRDQVEATGRAVVVDLFRAQATAEPVIGVMAPVLRDGKVVRVVGVWTDPTQLSRMLAAQDLPMDGFATVIDRQGAVIARSVNHARFVGQRVSDVDRPDWLAERMLRTRNLEGREMLIAMTPLAHAPGWMMAVAEPWARFSDARAGSILRLIGGGFGALALGSIVAVALARRILRPVQMLARDAALVVSGPTPAARAPSGIRELDSLASAIGDAREELRDRAAAAAAAEAEARAQRDLLVSVIDATAEPVFAKDRRGCLRLVNLAMARTFNRTKESMVGLHTRDTAPAAEAEESMQWDRRVVTTGQPETREHEVTTALGRRRFVTTRMPWRGADGTIIGVVGVARDITEARQAQARLDEAQARLFQVSRLGATAAMAAGLAHEINQPLTAAANYLRAGARMLGGTEDPPPTPERLEQARKTLPDAAAQAVRAGEILRRLRGFITRGETERQPHPIAALLRDAMPVLRAALEGERASLALEIDPAIDRPGQGLVLVDPVQLQQVLFNLVRNAAEAMRGQAESPVLLRARKTDAGIEIGVIDRGPGILPEVLAHLFEPFITTKPDGLGVGLAICRSVIEAHGGTLAVAANPDGGSIFTFTLQPEPAPTDPAHISPANVSEASHA